MLPNQAVGGDMPPTDKIELPENIGRKLMNQQFVPLISTVGMLSPSAQLKSLS